jgi:hypothetical protein
MRCCQRLGQLGCLIGLLENKKGPEEAPCTPPGFGMALAIPGGAPGYDDNKQFGNFIAHMTARTSQRLRGYNWPTPEVKGGGA